MITPTLPLVQKDESAMTRGWVLLPLFVLVCLPILILLSPPIGAAVALVVFAAPILGGIMFGVARDPRFRRDLFKQAAIGLVIILALYGLLSLIQ